MANTTFNILPSIDGKQYSQYPAGNYIPAPTGLTASASGSLVTLDFTDNTLGLATNILRRSTSLLGTYSDVATLAPGVTHYVDTLTTSGTYYYQVTAYFSGAPSAVSNTASATIAAVVAPTLASPSMTSDGANIAFSGGSGYTTLIPQYSSNSGSTWTSIASDTTSPLTFTGLAAGAYSFRALADGAIASNVVTGTVAASGGWQLAAGHFESAKIAMEIIAPRAGLTTANRYYKQYPGIPYRVPVAVLGGAWPFKYELTTAPSGMTIGSVYGDTDYGVINWSNPTTSGSPHTIAVKVTDQDGTICTVSYTLTVSTSGHLFIDAVNGNDANAGTLASPKKTVNGWYIAYTDTTYQNYFIWYRTGTYPIADANDPTGKAQDDGSGHATPYTRCYGARKPFVHLAYPGETATFDANGAGFIYDSGSGAAPVMCGMSGTGVGSGSSRGLLWWDSAPHALMFENNIGSTAAGVASTNASIFMSRRNSQTNYQAIIGNTFNGVNGHDLFLAYDTNKTVAENNTITNYTGGGPSGTGHGFFFKESNTNASVRNNRGLSGNAAEIIHITMSAATFSNIEVCWNNYKSTLPGIWVGPNVTSALTGFDDYRNTWQVPYNEISIAYGGTMTGAWNSQKNVIQHNGTDASGILIDTSEGGGANFAGTLTENNLIGTSGVVDSAGLLTGSNRTTYLGVRGCEVA